MPSVFFTGNGLNHLHNEFDRRKLTKYKIMGLSVWTTVMVEICEIGLFAELF